MTDADIIYIIQHWAKDKPHFDTDFVDKMQKKLAEFGYLTEGQRAALDKTIDKWRIPH